MINFYRQTRGETDNNSLKSNHFRDFLSFCRRYRSYRKYKKVTIEVKMEIFKEACLEVSHGLHTPLYLLSANVSPSEKDTKGGHETFRRDKYGAGRDSMRTGARPMNILDATLTHRARFFLSFSPSLFLSLPLARSLIIH